MTPTGPPQMILHRIRLAVVACALAVVVPVIATPAAAAPAGTIKVAPSMGMCGVGTGRAVTACAAAYVQRWLRHVGRTGAVRETVWVSRGAVGGWPSRTVPGGVCGFAQPLVGLHHCDGTTFVHARDESTLRSDATAIVALLHESGHGIQELAGLDPVAATLGGDRLFQFEQSADCWAGMGVRWLIDTHQRPATTYTAGTALLRAAGGTPDRDHGSGAQRAHAFAMGYTHGAMVCNTFVNVNGVSPEVAPGPQFGLSALDRRDRRPR